MDDVPGTGLQKNKEGGGNVFKGKKKGLVDGQNTWLQ